MCVYHNERGRSLVPSQLDDRRNGTSSHVPRATPTSAPVVAICNVTSVSPQLERDSPYPSWARSLGHSSSSGVKKPIIPCTGRSSHRPRRVSLLSQPLELPELTIAKKISMSSAPWVFWSTRLDQSLASTIGSITAASRVFRAMAPAARDERCILNG